MRTSIAVLAVALMAVSPLAHAQDEPEPPAEAAPDDTYDDGDLEAGGEETPAVAEPEPVQEEKDEVPISDAARKHFRAGVAYLQDPDGARYDEAYLEFKAAYADSPSPKMLGNIGLCAMKIERIDEAIEAYERYLAEVSDMAPALRAQVEADFAALQASAVKITVTVNVPGVKLVDTRQLVRGFPVTNNYGPVDRSLTVRVKPGKHIIVAERAGYEDQTWEVNARPGDVQVFAFELKEIVVEEPLTASDVVPWLFIGLGVGAGVAAAVTGNIALNKRDELNAECPNGTCPFASEVQSKQDDVKTFSIATDVLIAGGATLVVGGAIWLAVDAATSGDEVAGNSVRFSAGCSPYGCASVAEVSF